MKKILVLFYFFGLLLFFYCNVETGLRPVSNIYIDDQTGNDRNPGTIKKPLRTIPEVNKRIQEKPASLYFAGGQIFEGNLILQNLKGSEADSIFIGSYGKGRAIINGVDREAIRIENCSYIRIENLDLKGSGRKNGNTTNGLSLVHTTKSRVGQINAEGFQKSGVDLYDCRNIDVKSVFAYNNGFCGINVMGSDKKLSGNILIQDCKAENNPGDPTILDNHSGNGILVGVSDSVMIDHCTATNNGWDMPRQGNGPVGIWTWQSDHITIQYCISYRNKTSEGGKDGGGFDLDGGVTNSVIQYCLSYENHGAGYGLFQYPGASNWSNNTIRYCVSINDAHTTEGAGSFFIWNGSDESKQLTGCYIYNNVAYNSSAPVISFENASDHESFNFCNNIFLGSGQLISGKNTGSKFIGNVWWTAENKIKFMEFRSLAEWAEATGQETLNGRIIGIQKDPFLRGPFDTDITDPYNLNMLIGYTLRPDSPLRNQGIDIQSIYGAGLPQTDFYGNPIPQGDDIEPGIFEIK
ncbi:MAG: right-handed parallel beta-helix repeat-containing protein [Bacteroidales bacterium]|nr:right-handed parallel beta-helix repeat-containing protein [Bacteroidales bacterium]